MARKKEFDTSLTLVAAIASRDKLACQLALSLLDQAGITYSAQEEEGWISVSDDQVATVVALFKNEAALAGKFCFLNEPVDPGSYFVAVAALKLNDQPAWELALNILNRTGFFCSAYSGGGTIKLSVEPDRVEAVWALLQQEPGLEGKFCLLNKLRPEGFDFVIVAVLKSNDQPARALVLGILDRAGFLCCTNYGGGTIYICVASDQVEAVWALLQQEPALAGRIMSRSEYQQISSTLVVLALLKNKDMPAYELAIRILDQAGIMHSGDGGMGLIEICVPHDQLETAWGLLQQAPALEGKFMSLSEHEQKIRDFKRSHGM